MKTIGLIGGMSWESTQGYYRILNEQVKARLGGLHSAKLVLHSVDFDPIEKLQHQGKWDATADILCDAARSVEAGGADCVLICTNTMHKVAPQVAAAVSIPLLHIADATAAAIKARGLSRVGLLGTGFTMEQEFYKGRLCDQHGLEVLIPNEADRGLVHRVIYEELCLGRIVPESKTQYLRIIAQLAEQGAEAVILGCTEIGMLVQQNDTALPLFDTSELHACSAVDFALA
ncbi:aspartate/glutamate racemase family protein [Motiliproteus coralliicola]|uniref:Aspartate/glutamate racemase family protein n=1 Tax=Motiliproteus coralliicola TaxID=2283196 RepID=A0A369WCU8_9GAMM|nr:aspartate/glutamate racemase family protein [Motiliproteus coralliicola]RDE19133.1 aspartate/glutamate racemase family protein [Motiliproteus coralliicola]